MKKKEDKKKIRENPSYVKMTEELKGIELVAKGVSFLGKLGLINEETLEHIGQIPKMKKDLEEHRNMPDSFNEHFSELGWVAYESMNMDLMRNAVELADKGSVGEAEDMLVEYFDEKNLEVMLTRMHALEEYLPRKELLNMAKEDYLAGRYHASIPVVLMAIDGIVNDVSKQKGFFAGGVDLEVWDSIAAHSSGLQNLNKLFNESRKKTTTEEIFLPYRHGIIHGRDLGYANKKVATKVWAVLFVIRDWAVALRDNKRADDKEDEKSSWIETVKTVLESKKEQEKIASWKPRNIKAGDDYPLLGVAEEYGEGTPERALVEFMQYWRNNNYGAMAQLIKLIFDEMPISTLAGQIRESFQENALTQFRILNVKDVAASISEVIIETDILSNEELCKKEFNVRMIYDKDGKTVVGGEPGGKWLVIENSFGPMFFVK